MKKSNKEKSFYEQNRKFIWYIGIFVAILILMAALQPVFQNLVDKDPEWHDTYIFVKQQLDKNSMLWLFVISVIAGLFFIGIPIDLIFIFYLIRHANPGYALLMTLAGVMIGRTIDYWIGFIFSKYVTKNILKQDYRDFNKRYSKLEGSILFFGNFIPFFPIEPYIVFIGTIKYDFWKFLLYTFLGKLAKLLLIVLFFEYVLNYREIISFNFFDFVRNILEIFL